MVVDGFEEMLVQSERQPLVFAVALHPCLFGQPHRLRRLRTALQPIAPPPASGGPPPPPPRAIATAYADVEAAGERG